VAGMSGLERGAADECLLTVFGAEYGDLTIPQASALIADLLAMNQQEDIGDLYAAARLLARRLHPATLHSYAATLQAGQR